MPVASPHRRAHGEEHEVRLAHRRRKLGREADPPHAQVALKQLLEARLVDRHMPATELLDPLRILVGAGNLPAEFGEAGGRDEADIARPDHADVHGMCPWMRRMPGSRLPSSFRPAVQCREPSASQPGEANMTLERRSAIG